MTKMLILIALSVVAGITSYIAYQKFRGTTVIFDQDTRIDGVEFGDPNSNKLVAQLQTEEALGLKTDAKPHLVELWMPWGEMVSATFSAEEWALVVHLSEISGERLEDTVASIVYERFDREE